jgi:hypothetical protein
MAVGAYLVLGVLVLLSRLVFPKAKVAAEQVETAQPAPATASNTSEDELSLAA